MNSFIILLLTLLVFWHLLRNRYQRERIAFLGRHLSSLQLEKHMETLTTGYTRAIKEPDENRQRQILETFAPAERAAAAQMQTLADAIQKADAQSTAMGPFSFCFPYVERLMPSGLKDFREVLQIHAKGLRRAVDNDPQWDLKTRAFHLSAELYLFQHTCHWFCKSRVVADARLQVRHQLTHQKVVDSVADATRLAYGRWLAGDR